MSQSQFDDGTRTRRRMLEYIAAHHDEHGWAPTIREIAGAVGLSSPASVHRHLRLLHDQGELVLGNGPRMIRLTTGHIELRPSGSHVPPYMPPMADDGRLLPGR